MAASERVIDPTRQGIAVGDAEGAMLGQATPVSLEEACAIVDGWDDGYAPFRLHQMCRVLRQAYEDRTQDLIATQSKLIDANHALFTAREERNDLQRTFDLRWAADMRAIKRWQAAHPGNEMVWPDRADLVVWLLHAIECWDRFCARADAALPCARDETECGLHGYPWAPCCRLRAAAWFGEPFPTDHLPDEGCIHLFDPPDPACPNAPRKSAGCVQLIEPALPEDQDWLEE